ncbi:MAG TPA: serine/threonine-protein kinase, partial [Polyangiaceae bacterium]
MDLYPGARLDRYVLLELLGEGGQGAVWKAKDPLGDGQLRALKLVGLSLSRPNDVERVRREARALSRLQHPSLTTCHALFEDLQRGALGVVMDYVEAVSLKKAQDDPRLDLALKLKVLSHIAHSLAYVHEQGVTHRDLKLDNVLLTHEFWQAPDRPENLKLVDFGIAAVSGNPQPLTALDTVVGTLAYLAPELIDPAHFSGDTLAPTLDIFAFGILGHKLLFGSHPAQTPPNASLIDYAMAYRHAQRLGAAWPEKLEASGLPGVLRDCLALKVDKRIRNGTELSLRVDRALAEPFDTAPYQAMEPPTHVEKADVIPAASESVQSQPVSVTAQTAIASPGAMLGETVEYPVVIASGN